MNIYNYSPDFKHFHPSAGYLLSTCLVTGAILGARQINEQMDKNLYSQGASSLVRTDRQWPVNKLGNYIL